RLPMALAAGALAVATAVTPAFAADDPNQGGDEGNWSQQSGGDGYGDDTGGFDDQGGDGGHDQQSGGNGGSGGYDSGSGQQAGAGGNGNHQAGADHGNQGEYRGRVTAQQLALRTAPNRGARVIRYAHRGEVVSI